MLNYQRIEASPWSMKGAQPHVFPSFTTHWLDASISIHNIHQLQNCITIPSSPPKTVGASHLVSGWEHLVAHLLLFSDLGSETRVTLHPVVDHYHALAHPILSEAHIIQVYNCVYTYIYIYMYIRTSVIMCVYIYVNTYRLCICIYIYIYYIVLLYIYRSCFLVIVLPPTALLVVARLKSDSAASFDALEARPSSCTRRASAMLRRPGDVAVESD